MGITRSRLSCEGMAKWGREKYIDTKETEKLTG